MANLTGHTYKALRDMPSPELEQLVADARRERTRLFWSSLAYSRWFPKDYGSGFPPGGQDYERFPGHDEAVNAWIAQLKLTRQLQAALLRRQGKVMNEDFWGEFDTRFGLDLNDKRGAVGPNLEAIYPGGVVPTS